MNDQLQQFARQELKDGLAKCTDAQQLMSRRMYSHSNLELGIEAVVDAMPEEKLDHAMRQVQNTTRNNTKKEAA